MVILGVALVFTLSFVAYRMFSGTDSTGAGVDVRRLGKNLEDVKRSEALGGANATPDLAARMQAQDNKEAAQAIEGGKSFFPIMTPGKAQAELPSIVTTSPTVTSIEQKSLDSSALRPVKQDSPDVTNGRTSTRADDKLRKQAMLDAMRKLRQDMTQGKGELVEVKLKEDKSETTNSKDKNSDNSKKEEVVEASPLDALLVPGAVFYVVNEYEVDSDLPNKDVVFRVLHPVEAEDGRFFGEFKRQDEILTIEVNRLVLNGTEYSLRGVAIDPDDARFNVATSVDTHFLERWGGLLAASLVEGISDAVKNSKSKTTISDGTIIQSTEDYSTSEIVLEGAGKVGNRVATQLEKSFSRAPTVRLHPGAEVGVLIFEVSQRRKK